MCLGRWGSRPRYFQRVRPVSPWGLRAGVGEERRREAEEYADVRRHAAAAAVALTLVAGLATAPGWVAVAADGHTSDTTHGHPSRADVRDARHAADDKAVEVATVQARLVEAQSGLQSSVIRVAQAEEAFNRARWSYREA